MFVRAVVLALAAAASASPLWLRPERPLGSHLSTDPRALADYQLPTDLTPVDYDITLHPFLDTNAPTEEQKFTFDGIAVIRVKCEVATSKIQMHAFDITFAKSDIQVKAVGATVNLGIRDFTVTDDDKQFFTINMSAALEAGKEYQITVKYVGKLNTALEGFYRSSYVEEGVTKYMAVTQFESTGARRAFPCFDEPGMKAEFKIKIARSDGYTVLGNMPIVNEEAPVPGLTGFKYTEFEKTVKMSTYLVAFSVNMFGSYGELNEDNIKYNVWARPNAVPTGQYASETAPKVVADMTAFTGHRYALPKIDQIAVPDFAAGAMENWGLITYRETALLYDPDKSSETNKQRVGAVVTHELAHQWFGNLVSPEWWSNLWLNEGFATYFEYHALNRIEDTWKMDQQFIYEQLHEAFNFDALESTHPIVADVDSPSTIDTIFDDISYNKGGCMVRFLVNLLGEDNFKTGIQLYLENNKFGNANADSLWEALQTEVEDGLLPEGMTLKNVMDTWTLQGGYPVVKFERLYDSMQRAIVTQERFLSLPSETSFPEKWVMPLVMTTRAQQDFANLSADAWLTESTLVLDNVAGSADWVILNLQQMGFFRVNYDANNWKLLASALNEKFDNIHVINRAQLINDALTLARANMVDYSLALDTTSYLTNERDYLPWATAFSSLAFINDRLSSDAESRKFFEAYLTSRLLNTYNALGGFTIPEAGDDHVTSMTRSMVLKWACQLGHKDCIDKSNAQFTQWQGAANPDLENPIHANVKSVVYCAGMRVGDQADWEFLFARYEAAFETATEQALILNALGCSSDVAILESYLNLTIQADSPIRSQDKRTVLSSVYNNPLGVDLALKFLIDNFEVLQSEMGGFSSVARVFTGISSKLNTPEQQKMLQDFYDANESSLGGVKPAVEGALATVAENIKWQTDYKLTVVDYLKAKSSATLAVISPLLILIASIFSKIMN